MTFASYAPVTSEIALYLGVAAVGSILIMTRRALRTFSARIAPAGALMTAGGPPRGAQLGALTAMTLNGETQALGAFGSPALIMFVADSCPISSKLIPIARAVARVERLVLVLAGDEETSRQKRFAERLGQSDARFINDADLGRTLGVDKLPYAFLLDATGCLVARGLVNSREHLESLVTSGELGIDSLQAYLAANPAQAAAFHVPTRELSQEITA